MTNFYTRQTGHSPCKDIRASGKRASLNSNPGFVSIHISSAAAPEPRLQSFRYNYNGSCDKKNLTFTGKMDYIGHQPVDSAQSLMS